MEQPPGFVAQGENSEMTKDLGRLQYFLGIEAAQSRQGISICQRKYTVDILDETVIRILRYIKRAPGRGLLYTNKGNAEVSSYSDADWVGSPSDRQSTSGYCALLGGNVISWKSKMQTVVARPSAEAEYRAMENATCEFVWLKQLLNELHLCE
ncbi:secreted RxLR effector protein 161-like [Gastrolobium bilobum]|uniref:secreted RxLR effector protein 161-like n=1 Tax=Gastrolobium bilobum TaxID=150636 RepID=UPI002AB2171A|nr:secreted RxLR effector protein 161-like [Gastrolobium bilobum]